MHANSCELEMRYRRALCALHACPAPTFAHRRPPAPAMPLAHPPTLPQMITHSNVIAAVLVVDATALLMYNVSGMCVTGHLGAVFR